MLFQEYLVDPKKGDTLSQVLDQASFRRTEQGSLNQTFNPLDMAVSGDGYFSVETDQGVKYTRAGNFALNNEGFVVTPEGHNLLDDGNNPMQIPAGETHIQVTSDGVMTTNNSRVGKVKMVTFDNPQAMVEIGGGLYDIAENLEIEDTESQIIQGAIETSNVNAVAEMTRMIEISRTYQSLGKMMQNDHDRQRSAIRTLTNTNA